MSDAIIVTLAGTLSLEPIIHREKDHIHCHQEMGFPGDLPTGVRVYDNIQSKNQQFQEPTCTLITMVE